MSDSAQIISELSKLHIVEQAFVLLRTKLPPNLIYHSLEHSQDVFNEAITFALNDKLSSREVELLAVAAAYHDTGFIEKISDNEEIGAVYAERAMQRASSYSQAEIKLVTQAILDTKIVNSINGPRQVPTSPLAEYLCDADLSNLGRSDFFEKSEQIYKESSLIDRKTFFKDLETLIETKVWFTPAARQMRSDGVKENLNKLRLINNHSKDI